MPPSSKHKPRLLVVAGPNGAGKTTITEQGLRHQWFEGCHYINPDLIAQNELGDWNNPEAILNAARLADTRREEILRNKQDLAFETVLSTEGKLDFMQRAKASGYFIRLFFVGTSSPAINAARIVQRVLQGGHEVPILKIISRYTRSMGNSIKAARLADRAYFYDNSEDDASAVCFSARMTERSSNFTGINPNGRHGLPED
ncbi:MAG: zeta toxin family protein [Luteolibacter sp.]